MGPRQWQKFAVRDLNIEENALFLNKNGACFTSKGHFLGVGKKLGGGGKCPPAPPPRFRRPCLGFILEVDGCGWVANLCVIETPNAPPGH